MFRSCRLASSLLIVFLGTLYPSNLSAQEPDEQFLFERSLNMILKSIYATGKEYGVNPFRAEQMMKQVQVDYANLFPPPPPRDWVCMINQIIDFGNTQDIRFQKFDSEYIGILCTHNSRGVSTVTYIIMLPRTDDSLERISTMRAMHDIFFTGEFMNEDKRKSYFDKMIAEDSRSMFDYMVVEAESFRSGRKHRN